MKTKFLLVLCYCFCAISCNLPWFRPALPEVVVVSKTALWKDMLVFADGESVIGLDKQTGELKASIYIPGIGFSGADVTPSGKLLVGTLVYKGNNRDSILVINDSCKIEQEVERLMNGDDVFALSDDRVYSYSMYKDREGYGAFCISNLHTGKIEEVYRIPSFPEISLGL